MIKYKICPVCGASFTFTRDSARYCSNRCRQSTKNKKATSTSSKRLTEKDRIRYFWTSSFGLWLSAALVRSGGTWCIQGVSLTELLNHHAKLVTFANQCRVRPHISHRISIKDNGMTSPANLGLLPASVNMAIGARSAPIGERFRHGDPLRDDTDTKDDLVSSITRQRKAEILLLQKTFAMRPYKKPEKADTREGKLGDRAVLQFEAAAQGYPTALFETMTDAQLIDLVTLGITDTEQQELIAMNTTLTPTKTTTTQDLVRSIHHAYDIGKGGFDGDDDWAYILRNHYPELPLAQRISRVKALELEQARQHDLWMERESSRSETYRWSH